MNDINERLILVVAASYKGAVGFGEIFDCEIRRVLAGTIDEPRIQLSILAGDRDKLEFILNHLSPEEIEIGFKFNRKDEPYSMSPISGFVDGSKTSWEIEYIREAVA